jgi:PAS domain S-box-containing protein
MTQITQYLTAAVFVVLTGVVSVRCWRDRSVSRTSGWWAAATFGCFAALLVLGLVADELEPAAAGRAWIARVTITLLVLFPWLMFRFAAGFRAASPWLHRAVATLTAVVAVSGWFLPGLGDPEADTATRPVVIVVYLWALIGQWVTLLGWAGFQLWRAGRHEPPVARKRVRVLAVAAIILAADLLIALVVSMTSIEWLTLGTQILALASGLLFYAGLVPPRWLLSIWRRSTEKIWEQAVHGVVAAGDFDALRAALLHAAVALVGARRGTIVTPTSQYELVAGQFTEVDRHHEQTTELDPDGAGAMISTAVGADTLIVWASPFAVFFGDEERRLLEVLGSFAALAGQRLELSNRMAQAAERQLRDTQAEAEAVLESAGEAIITFDDSGRLLSANPAAERLFLESSSGLVGRPLDQLFPQMASTLEAGGGTEDSSELPAGAHPAAGSVRLESAACTTSGQEIPVEITITQVMRDGERLLICVARDVSERRLAAQQLTNRAEELARSNAELQQFAYVASHDLQEPLRKVASYVQVLEADYADQLDDQARQYIHFATDAAQRMRRLIEDLLAVSRVRIDQMEVEECDLGQIVNDILEDFAVAVTEAGATVTVGELPRITADPTHLRQALQNLISNALKYRGEAPPQIDIRAEPDPQGWLFTVQDNGIGFKQEYADQIFGMFQRLVSRSKYEGTGMGLAIVAKVIQNHNGQIWATSQPGGPTVISFRLPATVAPSPVSGIPRPRTADDVPALRDLTPTGAGR